MFLLSLTLQEYLNLTIAAIKGGLSGGGWPNPNTIFQMDVLSQDRLFQLCLHLHGGDTLLQVPEVLHVLRSLLRWTIEPLRESAMIMLGPAAPRPCDRAGRRPCHDHHTFTSTALVNTTLPRAQWLFIILLDAVHLFRG